MGLFSIFSKSNILYFPGCVTYFKYKDNFELYKKIFLRLGIEFKIIEENVCCGLPALESGYEAEARKLARKNFEMFKEKKIISILAFCPSCYKMFLQDYPKMLPDWDIEAMNIWKIILEKLEEKPHLIKNKTNETIAFQDSCYLGRYCEIYEEPRKILRLIGYELKEMNDSKENAMCCGSCGGLARVNPELADKVAKERLLQAKRLGVKKIVACSLDDYELLKKNSEGMNIEILEFGEILGNALKIKKKEDEENIAISNKTINHVQGEQNEQARDSLL